MEVVGDIGIFESQKACAPLRKHLLGRLVFAQWGFLGGLIVGEFIFSALVDLVAPGFGVIGLVAWALGAFYFWVRYARGLAPKAWLARGVAAVSQVTYRIDDAGMAIDNDVAQTRLAWSGISQIAPGVGSWLFIGPGQAWFLPRRLFAEPATERAFLAACLERMSPEAKARSNEAVALVATAG